MPVGKKSNLENVRWTGPVPSARMIQMSTRLPSLDWRLNAIRLPFGEKSGRTPARARTSAGPRCSRRAHLPDVAVRENVILAPFGDQSGRSSTRMPAVSRMGFEPSASITQMSSRAARSLVNAIFVPSGDHSGNASKPAVNVSRVWLSRPRPSPRCPVTGRHAGREGDLRAVGRPVGHVSCTSGVNVIRSRRSRPRPSTRCRSWGSRPRCSASRRSACRRRCSPAWPSSR